ncbi:MAG: PQQ-dependent dehydrogenase, methanol/ethanol family [Pseudomonadota bacterium]|nr:PQQ-dependent dehydrogenase, methanol/ethanol family [Pseudomonadota bacterium]
MNRILQSAGAVLLVSAIVAGGVIAAQPSATNPLANPANLNQARMLQGTSDGTAWPSYGGSYDEQRFSPLTAINDRNVAQLGLAWYGDYDSNQNQHGSPLYADGVIYVSASRNHLYAFDARTGKRLWQYAPAQVPHQNLGNVNKGIAMWNGKIYMGTLDGRLVAISAKTGKPVWEADTIPANLVGEANRTKYSVSMAPRAAKGKVFVGASGGEFGSRGFISAYDAETGKEVWRFWTVPGDPAKGHEAAPQQKEALAKAATTWKGEYWTYTGGGGAVWDAVIYDPVTDLLIFGTGQPSPWNSAVRDRDLADNLYTNSIVAVRPDTGEYVWHYQATPGDSWDYDNVSPMMTADLDFNGTRKHVVIQPSKNGMLYVVEAATGKLISGDAFTVVNWNTGIDMKTGRPIEVPEARYLKEPWNVAPGPPGGHTWHPNAFSPLTGLIYIPTWENYGVNAPQTVAAGANPPLISFAPGPAPAGIKPNNNSQDVGWLQAWDPVARKVVWETPKAPRATSGALATAGNLVFMGNSRGQILSAYNAKTGAKLWEFPTQGDVYAGPISYELDGVQYIAASVGGAGQGDYFAPGYGRILVFKVGGTTVLPPKAPYTPRQLNPPPVTASAEAVARGTRLYADHCSVCHGANAAPGGGRGGNSAPDLGTSPFIQAQAAFDTVVLQGQRVDKGMPTFSDKLKADDSAAVLAYVVARANERKNAPAGAGAFGPGRGAAGPARGGLGGPGAGAPAPAPRAGGAATAPAPQPPRDIHQEAAGQ